MTPPTPSTPLHVERTAPKTYIGRNERGAEVQIGSTDAPGVFAPGELLALAFGACGLLSADHTLSNRLGDDFAAHVNITATKDADRTRYEAITADLLVNLAALEPDKRDHLIERAGRVIERLCTIGHTLDHGANHEVTIRDEQSMTQHI